MSDWYPRLRIRKQVQEQNWRCTREGISLCFYTQRPHYEIMQNVWNALWLFLRSVGEQSLDRYTDLDGYWQPLDESGWESCIQQLFGHQGGSLELKGVKGDNFAYEFLYYGTSYRGAMHFADENDVCTTIFSLPTEYLEEHGPEKVRELALELARELPFDSGHAGLCLHYMTGSGAGVNPEVGRLSFRYPGLDLFPDSYRTQPFGTRLDGVHWLNFLGQPVLSELGGIKELQARLHSPSTTVYSLQGGQALVTLGPWPESGDLEQGRTLPHYRELARVLEPWLFLSRDPSSCLPTQEEMRRWERRFLD